MVLSTEKCNIYMFIPAYGRRFTIFSKPAFIEEYVPKQYTKRVCLDIALLCILGGNDYLPKIRRCDPLSALGDRYYENGKFLLNYSNGVVKLNLEAFVTVIGGRPIEKTDHIGDVHDAPGYLGGILWNMQMYLSGKCADYEFNVPQMADYNSILSLYHRNLKEGKSNVLCSGTTYIEHPLNAHAFSLGILPKECWMFFDQEGPIEIWEDPNVITTFGEILKRVGTIGKAEHSPTLVLNGKEEHYYVMKPYLDGQLNSYQIPWNYYKRLNFMTSVDYRRPSFQDFDVKDEKVTFFKNTSTFYKKTLKREFYCYFHVVGHAKFDPMSYFGKLVHTVFHETRHVGWVLFKTELDYRKSLKFGCPENVKLYGFGKDTEFLYPVSKGMWMYFEISHGKDQYVLQTQKFKFFLDAIELEINKLPIPGVTSGWAYFANKEVYDFAFQYREYLKDPLFLESNDNRTNVSMVEKGIRQKNVKNVGQRQNDQYYSKKEGNGKHETRK
jgi:hypothetical protein